jgi:hypothetical protein
MQSRILANCSLAALAGAAMLAFSIGPAPAFTLSGPSLEQPVVSSQIEKVWWRGGWGWHRGWGWHHRGWGWRAGWGGPGWGWHRGWGWRAHWGGGWGWRRGW